MNYDVIKLTVTLRIAFARKWEQVDSYISIFYTIDYIGDIIFLIDIYLNFRYVLGHVSSHSFHRTAYKDNGYLVTDAK